MVKELEVRGKIFLLLKRIFFSIFTLMCVGENTLTPSEAETTSHNCKILILKDSVKIQRLAEVNENKMSCNICSIFQEQSGIMQYTIQVLST